MTQRQSIVRTLLVCAAMIALVVTVYGQTAGFEFVDFDDPEYVRANTHVLEGFTKDSVAWAFTATHMGHWNPLTWFSLMLDAQWWGKEPAGFHRTNVVLHAINVLLLFGGLRKLTGSFWCSALAAALFAVHPLHVESVAWVSERKDVLSTMFWLLTMWAWAWWVRKGDAWRYALAMIVYAMGLMAKPMLVTLPCALLLLDWWPLGRVRIGNRPTLDPLSESGAKGGRRSIGALIVEKVPLFALAAAMCAMSVFSQGREGAIAHELNFGQRAVNAFVSYTIHLRRLFWPSDLSIIYPHPSLYGGPGWPWWNMAISLAILTVITIAALLMARRRPYVIVGWLWFVGTLVPVIGFVQIGYQGLADRYTYVPMIGMYVIIAWAGGEVAISSRWSRCVVPASMCVAVLVLAARAHVQTGYWRDSHTLFGRGLELRPDNWIIHRHLAVVLKSEGKIDEALAHLDKALQVYPQSVGVLRIVSDIHAERGDLNAAIKYLQRAAAAAPEATLVVNDLGALLYRALRFDEAAVQFENAIIMDDQFAEPHNNLAVIAQRAGRLDVAEHHLRRAVAIDPAAAKSWKNLGLVMFLRGRAQEGVAALQKAVELGGPDGVEAQRQLQILGSGTGAQTRPSSP